MNTYRKKPVFVQAVQWFKHGDHPEVKKGPIKIATLGNDQYMVANIPKECGWIETLENAHQVTPGDYIIRGVQGEYYPCKPDIFEATYEKVDVEDA